MGICNSRKDYDSTFTRNDRHQTRFGSRQKRAATSKTDRNKLRASNQPEVHLDLLALRMKKLQSNPKPTAARHCSTYKVAESSKINKKTNNKIVPAMIKINESMLQSRRGSIDGLNQSELENCNKVLNYINIFDQDKVKQQQQPVSKGKKDKGKRSHIPSMLEIKNKLMSNQQRENLKSLEQSQDSCVSP